MGKGALAAALDPQIAVHLIMAMQIMNFAMRDDYRLPPNKVSGGL